ncbi:cofactor for methionyl-and glutamyl-trna [Grosmannia clavigera kw1407]|uniref:Cofactor for methionyl-and glutamyl-trna n=1 Tax=Grosmannia clavigera (strain kw1407 / UAMH 11150) TaxID=655863 RepID=F0X852_GROCL|nr:cofactor for methionyl-and glutamyl-trna [Grosmannia clavigera kw1407]EFX05578.1 cofactor for methionyl-and glutamyl-trna [Grosmannia clavigera kw1407]
MASTLVPIASQTYTPAEETEIQKWTAAAAAVAAAAEPAAQSPVIAELNAHLASRTTVLGVKPSKADVALYESLAPAVKAWTPEQRTGQAGHPHVVRLLDFVQSSPLFGLAVADADRIAVDADEILYVAPPIDPKAEKERLKKERRQPRQQQLAREAAAAPAAEPAPAAEGKKKEKKEKKERAPKQPKAPAAAAVPATPALIDLRVGHVLKAIKHPEADSLFVSTIAMGDAKGMPDTEEYEGQVVRTVCSGLNGLVPLEEMQGRRVVVVCNLKPVKMRGIKSAAMVLAASPRLAEGEEDHHGGPVELVNPPPDAPAGERVFFQGWQGEPEKQLNPKKKVWETFQPGFTTTDDLEVGFDAAAVKDLATTGLGKLVTAAGHVCTVKSLKGATVR